MGNWLKVVDISNDTIPFSIRTNVLRADSRSWAIKSPKEREEDKRVKIGQKNKYGEHRTTT